MPVQRMIFGVLILIAVMQVGHFYPLMPERMASHFNASGKADGWMTKEGFFGFYVGVLVLMALVFIFIPKFMLKIPDSMINLPNRDYWLAPERRAQTGEMIESYMNAAGNAVIALLLCVFHLAFSANLDAGGRLPQSTWILLAAFMIFMSVWTIRFLRAFRIPKGPWNP